MAPSLHPSIMESIDSTTLYSPHHIFSRALASTNNITCARPIPSLIGGPLYSHSTITWHQLTIYICAASLALTLLSSASLAWQHIRHYTAPQEQRQILRIIALPVFYCLFNFLALCWYETYQYIQPLAGLYESFAIAALFFLLLEWVCPEGTDREKFFGEFAFKDKKGVIVEGGSLAWFQRTWAQIFQYPLVTLVFTIIQIVTQYYRKYCSNSFAPSHAHLWLFLAGILIVAGALEATGAFAKRMRSEMSGTHKERAKIYLFLGIIFFQIIQGILFSILNGKLFSPTRLLTYNDINYGLPSLLTCLEAVAFSVLFHWAYSATEFKSRPARYEQDQLAPRLGTWRAVRDALDLSDIANAVWVALGFAWLGLVRWWNSEGAGKTGGSARGPVRRLVGAVAGKVRDRQEAKRGRRGGESPFDDGAGGGVGPPVPVAAREYVPLRGDGSRESSLSGGGGGGGRLFPRR